MVLALRKFSLISAARLCTCAFQIGSVLCSDTLRKTRVQNVSGDQIVYARVYAFCKYTRVHAFFSTRLPSLASAQLDEFDAE